MLSSAVLCRVGGRARMHAHAPVHMCTVQACVHPVPACLGTCSRPGWLPLPPSPLSRACMPCADTRCSSLEPQLNRLLRRRQAAPMVFSALKPWEPWKGSPPWAVMLGERDDRDSRFSPGASPAAAAAPPAMVPSDPAVPARVSGSGWGCCCCGELGLTRREAAAAPLSRRLSAWKPMGREKLLLAATEAAPLARSCRPLRGTRGTAAAAASTELGAGSNGSGQTSAGCAGRGFWGEVEGEGRRGRAASSCTSPAMRGGRGLGLGGAGWDAEGEATADSALTPGMAGSCWLLLPCEGLC